MKNIEGPYKIRNLIELNKTLLQYGSECARGKCGTICDICAGQGFPSIENYRHMITEAEEEIKNIEDHLNVRP